MQPEPVLYETHMHTPLCKHAVGQPEEYAACAEKRGLKGIIVTCHNPTNVDWGPNVRMSLDQFDQYVAMVDRARQAWAGQIDVRLGLESDYVPGMEPWLEELHGKAKLHYVLGSVHPQIPAYKEKYFNGDMVAFQRTYFEQLALAAETGLFDALSHPDLIKNSAPSQWDVERVMDTIHDALDRIADTNTAMELNTSGLNKEVREMNPGRAILTEMSARKIPVVIGADAHQPRRVAANFEDALDTLEEVGYNQVNIFLDRKRHAIDIDTARNSLKPG